MSAILTRRRVGVREKGTVRSGAHNRPLRLRRHQNLHYSKAQQHVCHGCRKTFSRLDALNVSTSSIAVHLSLSANFPAVDPDSPFFTPCLSMFALGRFRTIPSDTVSLWISNLRSEALIKESSALFSPSCLQFGPKVVWSVGKLRTPPPSQLA